MIYLVNLASLQDPITDADLVSDGEVLRLDMHEKRGLAGGVSTIELEIRNPGLVLLRQTATSRSSTRPRARSRIPGLASWRALASRESLTTSAGSRSACGWSAPPPAGKASSGRRPTTSPAAPASIRIKCPRSRIRASA